MNYNEFINLINADKYSDCLLRLPMYYELENNQIKKIIDVIIEGE